MPARITIRSSRGSAPFLMVQQHTERHEQEHVEHEMNRVPLEGAVLEHLHTVLQGGWRHEVEWRQRSGDDAQEPDQEQPRAN